MNPTEVTYIKFTKLCKRVSYGGQIDLPNIVFINERTMEDWKNYACRK